LIGRVKNKKSDGDGGYEGEMIDSDK